MTRGQSARRPDSEIRRGVYWVEPSKNLSAEAVASMAAKDSIGKAGEAARKAQRNRYMQRLIEDEDLRGNLLTAYGAARGAYGRMNNGKPASKAIFEDKKLQRELREAAKALKEASNALNESPKKSRRRKGGLGRTLLLLIARGDAGARAERGPALEGARPAVRRRGGVRLQLDHRPGGARAGRDPGRLMDHSRRRAIAWSGGRRGGCCVRSSHGNGCPGG